MPGFLQELKVSRKEGIFLLAVYVLSVAIRLLPKLVVDAHLPAFQADVWYRICMSQYILDNWRLPEPDIRYLAYGHVPMWYPPLSVFSLALLSKVTTLDLPTVCTRLVPFFEGTSPLSVFFLARYLHGRAAGLLATIVCAATPSFVYWTGIADPQSAVVFLIPIAILFFLTFVENPDTRSLLIGGVVLGSVFLFHLSYFLLVLALLCTALFCMIERKKLSPLLYLLVLFLVSQAVAAWWWLPRNLYYWWIDVLTTSSQFYTTVQHLTYFGRTAAVLALFGLLFSALSRNRYTLLLIFWMLPLLLETQNETILQALGRLDLSWSTLAKPLEGFRFYVFLAQPLSILSGFLLAQLLDMKRRLLCVSAVTMLLLAGGMAYDLYSYPIAGVLTNAGMSREEYDAAVFFRQHSAPGDRIIGDYYRAQMVAGVCGGRTLLGGLFPLRNVDYPYVSKTASKMPVVQDDIYRIYTSTSPEEAISLMRKYGATHLFYSRTMECCGYLGTSLSQGTPFGIPVALDTFSGEDFTIVYQTENVIIFALKTQSIYSPR